MKLLLVIKADENDADYVTKQTWLRDSSLIPLIGKVAAAVLKCDGQYNWLIGEVKRPEEKGPGEMYDGILTREEITTFSQYVPDGQYGIHTITSIEIHEIVNTIKLL